MDVNSCEVSRVQHADQPGAETGMSLARQLAGGAAQLTAVEAAIRGLAERGEFSGAILVARNGRPLLSQGYGWANVEQSTLNTPQTKFQIASISKQFTALAILILQEQGR